MKKSRRITALLLITAVFFLASGFELLPDVELSYKKPLIDLFGNTSPENPFFYSDDANSMNIPDEESPEKGVVEKETEDRHIVGVKYKTITLDGRECSLKELEDHVEKHIKKNSTILLWDNYAEYHTYTSVLNSLAGLKERKGFTLIEKALGEAP